jgi:hypothetical protein
MEKKKVLWFSRHDLNQDQLNGLLKLAGGGEFLLAKVDKTISSAEEIISEPGNPDIIAAVLPTQLLSDLKALMRPDQILAVPRSKRVRKSDGEYEYVHDYWEIVDECIYKSHRV